MKIFQPLAILTLGTLFVGATACNKNAAPADAAGTEESNDAADMPDENEGMDDDGMDEAADETGETVDDIGDDMTGEPPTE